MREQRSPRDCLDALALARLAEGHDASEAAIAHLSRCPRCRRRLEREREAMQFIAAVRSSRRQNASSPSGGAAASHLPLDASQAGPPHEGPFGELRGYRLLEEISHGGQAAVHRAIHEPTGRVVAVKVIRSRSTREQARLEREAALAARLRHPGIVTIHDCGGLSGAFAIAMELVDGVPLDEWAARLERQGLGPATIRRRKLEVVARICEAVDHAHRRGVIHRDLKPRNVLVDEADQPHVLDFGVAHEIDSGAAGVGGRSERPEAGRAAVRSITRTGEFAGTLAYAAPEQIDGSPHAADTRSDVYSLGVLLCELVAGQMPYNVDGPLERVARAISHDPPTMPRRDPQGLRLDADLVTIVLRALQKVPERRYSSADALGADLRRLLAGAPIDARRDSGLYVLRKTLARHKGAVAVGTGVAAAALAGAIALSLAYRDAGIALKRADLETARLASKVRETNLHQAIMLAAAGSVARAEDQIWREVLAPSSPAAVGAPEDDAEFLAGLWALRQLHAHSPCMASVALGNGGTPYALRLGDGVADVMDASGLVRRVELPDLRITELGRLEREPSRCRPFLAVDEEGTRAVVAEFGSATVRRFDLRSGRLLEVAATLDGDHVTGIVGAPDGKVVVATSRGLALWRGGNVTLVPFAVPPPAPNLHLMATNGRSVAYVTADPSLAVVDLESGQVLAMRGMPKAAPNATVGLAMIADGTVFTADSGVIAFEPADGSVRLVQAFHETLHRIAATRDGRRVATTSMSGLIRVNEADAPHRVQVLAGHFLHKADNIPSLTFSHDGTRLLSAQGDETFRAWRCDDESWFSRTPAHSEAVHTLAHDAGGNLLSIGADGAVVRTRGGRTLRRDLIPSEGKVVFGALSDDGRWLVDGEHTSTARYVLRDAETLKPLRTQEIDGIRAGPFAFSPDGSLLLVATRTGPASGADVDELMLVDLRNGGTRLWRPPGDRAGTQCVAFSPNGRTMACGLRDGRIYLFDHDATELPTPIGIGVLVRSVSFSPDGRRLVSAHNNGSIVLWDVRTGARLAEQPEHGNAAIAAVFSPDGRTIASASYGGEIGIWWAEPLRLLAMLRDDGTPIHSLLFSRDGGTLHVGTDSGMILTIDFAFHDAAIAANLEYWITMLERHGVWITNAAPMRAWAERVRGEK